MVNLSILSVGEQSLQRLQVKWNDWSISHHSKHTKHGPITRRRLATKYCFIHRYIIISSDLPHVRRLDSCCCNLICHRGHCCRITVILQRQIEDVDISRETLPDEDCSEYKYVPVLVRTLRSTYTHMLVKPCREAFGIWGSYDDYHNCL